MFCLDEKVRDSSFVFEIYCQGDEVNGVLTPKSKCQRRMCGDPRSFFIWYPGRCCVGSASDD
jgi:hypothetical protein